MDWRAVNFDWNRARAFLVTAEEGSLSAAARALGMAQPTLGRQVTALEEELGVVLFERVGRGLTLTPSGLELLDHVREMGEAANRVSLSAGGQSQSIEGTIAITATEIYCYYLLPPLLQQLRAEAPGIQVEVVASNDAVDLRRREADIALRNFRPTQPDLIARLVGEDNARLYASTKYLDRIGSPSNPSDLNSADFIGFDRSDEIITFLNEMGMSLTQKNFPFMTSSHLVHWALVQQGLGIGIFPDAMGDADPNVERVLDSLPAYPYPIWLTAHRELSTSRRVRLVYDFLAEALKSRATLSQ